MLWQMSECPSFSMSFHLCINVGLPLGSDGKVSACNAGDPGSIPGSGRSSGEGNDNPFQYSCLENPMDRGAWWAAVHEVLRVGHDSVIKSNHQMGL